MKKVILSIVFIFCLQGYSVNAIEESKPTETEKIIINLLMPHIISSVNDFYYPYLYDYPTVASYYGSSVTIINSNEILVEVLPYVGPHIAVGKDQITFDVSNLGEVTVKKYDHIESYQLPEHLQSLIKTPLP